MIKKILLGLLSILLLLIVLNFSLVVYGLKMGYSQMSIVWNAVPISEILANPATPDSTRTRLRFVEEIRQYAIDSIGLSPSENYTSMFDQKGKPLLWNLSATKPYAFIAKRWSFPIVGSFPYKGFFDLDDAREAGRVLKDEGWVPRIRTVGGWSTLGWFKDPILSNMLNRRDGSLANLIIHELTHSTLFVTDSITFNENLANFIGKEGAKKFLKSHFGSTHPSYLNYLNSESDSKKFVMHMINGSKQLDSLYQDPDFQNEADSIKDRRKWHIIDHIVTTLDTISFYNKKRYTPSPSFKPDNPFFMSYRRYNAKQNMFEKQFKEQFNSDFATYLNHLKHKYGK